MVLSKTQKKFLSISWQQGVKNLLLFFLVIGGIFLINKIKAIHEFPIRSVKIYGVKNLNPQEIQHILLPLVKKSFFAVEVELIKAQMLQLPWIAEVSVRRVWPDQVILYLIERNPLARWNENSLLSTTGEIFTPGIATYPNNLPQFVGPEGKQMVMLEFYSKLNDLLKPLHLSMAKLELSPYLSWNVELANGIKMRLGYKDVLTRVNHFVKVYPKIVGERATQVEYVDLRYPHGLAIRWKTIS